MASTRIRRHTKRARRRRQFAPPEPPITWGAYTGRRLSELSDDELARFARVDAQYQIGKAYPLSIDWMKPSPPVEYIDHAPYWCARFEIERRKPPEHRGNVPEIRSTDLPQNVARKMIDFAYKTLAKNYHPDGGGSHEQFLRLGEAKELLLKAIR